MKKLFSALILLAAFSPVKADTTPTDPGQVVVSLLQHVTGVNEFTSHGQVKLEFLDGIIEMGHYKGDYILALDGGVSNSLTPSQTGHLEATFGIHAHVISAINSFFNINPSLASTLKMIEATPRYSYDADVHHGVLGFTLGAEIPFQ